MYGIYQSSENENLIRTIGPHRELVTDKFFESGVLVSLEINNFLDVNNIFNIGDNLIGSIQIDIKGPLANIK